MRGVLAILVLLLAAPARAEPEPGGWRIVEQRDAMTDEVTRSACTMNADGFQFCVQESQVAPPALLFYLELPAAALDAGNGARLDPDRFPWLRIDANPVRNDAIVTLEPRPGVLVPRTVSRSAVIWLAAYRHGPGYIRPGTVVGELLSGRDLRVRYFLLGGHANDTTFDLAGIAEALTALGIVGHDPPRRATLEVGEWLTRDEAARALSRLEPLFRSAPTEGVVEIDSFSLPQDPDAKRWRQVWDIHAWPNAEIYCAAPRALGMPCRAGPGRPEAYANDGTAPARGATVAWHVAAERDPTTGVVTRAACATNDAAFRLCIREVPLGERITAELRFEVPEGTPSDLMRDDIPRLLVVPDAPFSGAEFWRRSAPDMDRPTPRTVTRRSATWVVMFREAGGYPRGYGLVTELMTGRSLRVSYLTNDEIERYTRFDLAGLGTVLAGLGFVAYDAPRHATLEIGEWRTRGDAQRTLAWVNLYASVLETPPPAIEPFRAAAGARFRLVWHLPDWYRAPFHCGLLEHSGLPCRVTPGRPEADAFYDRQERGQREGDRRRRR
jgi:hypothetical protein